MKTYPQLNLPPCSLRVTQRAGRTLVWCPLRKAWLVLTPEEWVRRHLIGMLTGAQGVPAGRIVQEYPVQLEGMAQRADLVVLDRRGEPLLLAECKAPQTGIGREAFAQAVRYNRVVGARLVMLTDGMHHYVYRRTDAGDYEPLTALPPLQ